MTSSLLHYLVFGKDWSRKNWSRCFKVTGRSLKTGKQVHVLTRSPWHAKRVLFKLHVKDRSVTHSRSPEGPFGNPYETRIHYPGSVYRLNSNFFNEDNK